MSPNPQSFLSPPSFEAFLAAKSIALRLFGRACWLRVPLRYSILLLLPSFYYFSSTHHRAFLLHILSLIAFASVLVISLKFAHPRVPLIRLLLSRTKVPTPCPPVVWCIGSKTQSVKTENYSGSSVKVYSNGDVYEGEFYKGKCSGSGVYYYYMSGRYEGDWIDEKYDGYGVETWAKGSRYRGQYQRGLRHGFGVYRFYTGDVYSGEWCNGQCQGCGVHTCEDGSWYVGEFKWGVKHGIGHYHFRNGDTYAGEYFADKMHGFGVYRFGSGHRYEGAWHEGRREGLGMYTFRDGETQLGHWKNGVLNASSTRDPLLGPPFSVCNTKVLNAVQEAQQAAEKAVSMVKVDERVKKAVAGANRAANAARVAAVKAVQNQMRQNNINGDHLPVRIM
ncbi:hypothetical protein LguiA_015249 [Lonicera macranthoides]